MHLFYTDVSRLKDTIEIDGSPLLLEGAPYQLADDLIKGAIKVIGVFDGLPFYLDEAGHFDHELSGFFSFVSTDGARSIGTLRAYAEQLDIWFRWLLAQGKTWREAKNQDLRAYYRVRRMVAGVSPSTWNLAMAAITRFYDWAVWQKLISETPIPYKWKRTLLNGEIHLVKQGGAMRDRGSENRVRFVTVEQFRIFVTGLRNVGGCRSRTSSRNIVLSKLLIQTGMRITEALKMRYDELPDPEDAQFTQMKSVPFRLRREITKGKKSRLIRIPKQILRDIHRYCQDERTIYLESREAHDPLFKPPEEIWLNEEGNALSRNAVEKTFKRAAIASGVDCTPHFLRHSFAIYTLSKLIQLMVNKTQEENVSLDKQTYLRICEDPVRKVQQLLGHAQISTTYKYLDYINLHDRLTDLAISEWSAEFCDIEELLCQEEE
ncbi:tyrosine-type recombinase/integrase [Pseudomonas sp. R37(2017)]|uniref:tyrosine-type recombinase/integrase n=1 Tax=Pseudomonas sp. R37(2017) TaxID=1981685 RepID=UPI001302C8EA|nr:tyrosine-type recombinase/integrase [Pseudomonas sp. R37(2017)]